MARYFSSPIPRTPLARLRLDSVPSKQEFMIRSLSTGPIPGILSSSLRTIIVDKARSSSFCSSAARLFFR